ncbi:hypothetical protein DFQ27_007042 [Actinomortierella ambigua]|uniref:F-box domain-containing protein n=1 Tax=Actinomortierella ambigua TaxID=1343610 RepID=A0A9P6QL21_9FUNG|nr:hypothetical protein DFQ27_007042 [Actinomortierella ambigua]
MAPICLLTIPEIPYYINSYLVQRDRLACVLVGKQWRQIFLPLLWRTVSFKSRSWPDQPLEACADFEHAVQENGEFIRHLQTFRLRELQFFLHHCHHLSSLSLRICSERDWPVVLGLVRNNPNLMSLSLTVMANYSPHLLDIFNNLPSLTTLDLTLEAIRQGLTPNVLMHLLKSLRQLQRLSIRANATMPLEVVPHDLAEENDRREHQEQTPFRYLRHLRLTMSGYHRSNLGYIVGLLKRCPSLETVQLPALHRDRLDDICLFFQHRNHHHHHHYHQHVLTSLDLSMLGYVFEDEALAKILAQLQPHSLRHLSLQSTAVGETTLDLLLRRFVSSLQTLDISRSTVHLADPGRWIRAILTHGVELIEFKCGARGEPLGAMVDLEVSPLLLHHRLPEEEEEGRKPSPSSSWWRCTKLQVLQIPLVGCRASPCTHNGACRTLQEQLYRQLGRLCDLRVLDLGIYMLPCSLLAESNCLEWSLAAGLEHLAGLRRLETFCVVGTKHAITVEEVRWMRSHWPRLQKVVGLAYTEAARWMESHWGSSINIY